MGHHVIALSFGYCLPGLASLGLLNDDKAWDLAFPDKSCHARRPCAFPNASSKGLLKEMIALALTPNIRERERERERKRGKPDIYQTDTSLVFGMTTTMNK